MTVNHHNPATLYKTHGFSHAVSASGSRLVFIGGQVATDPDHTVLGLGDYEKQGEVSMRNVGSALAAAGVPISDLVQLSIYIVDNTPERQEAVLSGLGVAAVDLRLRRTAMKIIGVQSLGEPDALVELDGVAVTDAPLPA